MLMLQPVCDSSCYHQYRFRAGSTPTTTTTAAAATTTTTSSTTTGGDNVQMSTSSSIPWRILKGNFR